jgi:hypothetical protein
MKSIHGLRVPTSLADLLDPAHLALVVYDVTMPPGFFLEFVEFPPHPLSLKHGCLVGDRIASKAGRCPRA